MRYRPLRMPLTCPVTEVIRRPRHHSAPSGTGSPSATHFHPRHKPEPRTIRKSRVGVIVSLTKPRLPRRAAMLPQRLTAPEHGWAIDTDVVVIGSGIAGLVAALQARTK